MLISNSTLEIIRGKSRECHKVRARSQISVPAALSLSSPHSAVPPVGTVGRVAPPPSQGWGRARERRVGYSVRFLSALPSGPTVRSPSYFLCYKGRDYFVHEELNLLRLPPERSRNLISSLPPWYSAPQLDSCVSKRPPQNELHLPPASSPFKFISYLAIF